ncbi:MAG: ABC transporter permease [Deinococcota bacterium]
MSTFLIKRLFQAVLAVWIVVTLVFVLLQVAGNPIDVLAPDDMTQLQRQDLARSLGLDQPLHIQYGRFLTNLVQGDLGISYFSRQPAMGLVLERFPATLRLILVALAMALTLGIPLGVWAAVNAGGPLDSALRFMSVIGISAPTFWIGILFILVFSVQLEWLPSSGNASWQHYILPGFTLALYRIAFFTRMVRSSMLDVLSQDFVRTGRSKGLSERLVTYKHAFRNALVPVITIVGLQFGSLLSGAVVTETIFAWPGMNRLVLTAMYNLDYPIILSFAVIVALLFAGINLIVDVLYGLIDPRVRYG